MKAIDVLPWLLMGVGLMSLYLVLMPIWKFVQRASQARLAVEQCGLDEFIGLEHLWMLRTMDSCHGVSEGVRLLLGWSPDLIEQLIRQAELHNELLVAQQSIEMVEGALRHQLSAARRLSICKRYLGVLDAHQHMLDPGYLMRFHSIYQRLCHLAGRPALVY